jgi:ribosomal protein S18 acetylase RimI-like enzyme
MIRGYRPADLAALRKICLLTGRAGGDATGQWSSDDLLPDVFLEPYVTLEPSTAWTVEQDGRPVGYLVAALDTTAFADRWRRRWSPVFAARHARTAEDPAEQWLRDAGYDPEWMLGEQVEAYPAHLHIDLLPAAQGSGWGRGLMRQLGRAAVAAGVPGIHLVMARENRQALAFYQRLGFTELAAPGDTLVLGIDPAALA